MRLFYLTFATIYLVFLQFSFFANTVLAECTMSSTLRVGLKGLEVQCLQSKLGIKSDGIFGPKTLDKVKLFQSINGLVSDGIVGSLTRAKLEVFTDMDVYPSGCSSSVGYSSVTGVKCDSSLNAVSLNSKQENVLNSKESLKNVDDTESNPNLLNLDEFITSVIEVSKKNGASDKELKILEDALRNSAVNSNIDYRKEFEKMIIEENASPSSSAPVHLGVFEKLFLKTASFLGFKPKTALAIGGIPFGGMILYTFFCPVSANWMITITPLPPSYVTVLSYYSGTQAFAGYNLPFARYLLGEYEPVGTCIIPGVPPIPIPIIIPTQGTITPYVGSSAL